MNLNNWHLKPKNSAIYTPSEVSQFIFNLLRDKFPFKSLIFDPCSGKNSLLAPWQQAGYQVWGNDNDNQLLRKLFPHSDLDFLTSEKHVWNSYFAGQEPTLVLCNPPFNGNRKKLAPEVWFDKIIELFGKEIPLVFFAPIGFRLNSTLTSRRYRKFIEGTYSSISSQIALTRDVYNLETANRKTEFHSEILIFNIQGLEPHYFFNHHES